MSTPGNRILWRVSARTGIPRMAVFNSEPRILEYTPREVFKANGARIDSDCAGYVELGGTNRPQQISERRIEAG